MGVKNLVGIDYLRSLIRALTPYIIDEYNAGKWDENQNAVLYLS
jgi:hypothetical protein